MTQPARLLAAAERDHIYERRIRPDLFAGALPSKSPVAMLIAGQPGAGVDNAAVVLRRELRRTTGVAVLLSAAHLTAYHPSWRELDTSRIAASASALLPDIHHWLNRAIQDAQRDRLHMMVEDELRDAKSVHRLAVGLRKDGYAVQAVFVCTSPDLSRLSVMACYDIWRTHGLTPNFVPAQEHEAALGNVRTAMGLLEDRRAVDGIRIIDSRGGQFYENRLVDGEWLRMPRAQATLDVERDRAVPPKELVKSALRWETLVQRLVHDPSVPREVASQTLRWHQDAVTRCEATPSTAQLLQWAHEGAAFRVMDRFEYEREFPHNARAVKSLGLAVIEAEKYPDAEGARFLAAARENIAQRIERGDIARIAAREKYKTQEPPTR